ncbi:MAG: restriction endonuclease [Moorea sp. SIO1G6]|nr:restriction endonuclease [Moorena sp. SIO3B2]NEQ14390.1 restriction endonuclease [Moorena sp. SIO3E2]NER89125.1 restriction endonuclease [Moorena sp. SIO3A2]NES46449.1 restriction endonuclease [Moorena sp. SIO2C4]NET68484.1 restriction endonuclease [Moorena sp. SIO1G6]
MTPVTFNLGQKATLREQPNNLQPSTCNLQPSTFNLGQKATLREQPPTCNLQPVTSNLQPPTF